MPSQSTPVVSLPLHHLLSLHVRKHVPNDPTGTEEPEDLLSLFHADALIVTLLGVPLPNYSNTVVGMCSVAVYRSDELFCSL